MNTERSGELPRALALSIWSRRFSAMVDAGISLMRCFEALRETPAPYGEAAARVMVELERGATLSRTMSTMPELFSPLYVALVRAGEVGGVLDLTLKRLVDLTSLEWRLSRLRGAGEVALFPVTHGDTALPEDWESLDLYQRAVSLVLYCETLGMLLSSGVPCPQALEVAAVLLPARQRAAMRAVTEGARQGRPLTPLLVGIDIFPAFVLALIEVGEENGTLDVTLHQASEVFEHELACRLSAEESV